MKRVILILVFFIAANYSAKADVSTFPAPTNLSVSNLLHSSADLSWSNNANASSWIVSYNVSQSSYVIEVISASNSIQVNNLISGVAYNWKVRMIDLVGDTTNWSNISIFRTPFENTGCNPISQLSINAMGQTGITIQWTADTTQTQWEVVYGELGSDPEYDGVSATTNNYFYLIPSNNLILNHWYQIAVRNLCQGANSGWKYINTRYISNQHFDLPVQQTFESDIQNSTFGFVNGTLNPWVLSNSYNATAEGQTSIYISSNGGLTNDYYPLENVISYAYIDVLIPSYATSFYLDFKWKCLGELGNDGMKVFLMGENTPLDIHQLPISSNQIGQTFYNNYNADWQSEHIEIPAEFIGEVRRLVFAWENNNTIGGVGGAIIDDIYITGRYCATPTNPTHNYVSSSTAALSWTFAQEQSNFNIQYRKAGTTQWNQINSVTSNYLLDSLDDNTTYIYRVQADCGMEESFFSEIDTFTTLIQCLPPENVHAISYTNNSAIITWNDDINVLNWIMEYGLDNGENTTYSRRALTSRFDTLTNLTPNSNYRVRVKAISTQNDTSRYSEEYIFHTLCNTFNQYPYNAFADTLKWTDKTGYSYINTCWELKGDTLLSPVFDFTNLGFPELNLKYMYVDSTYRSIKFKVIATNDGITYYNISNLNQTIDITQTSITLTSFSTMPYVRVAFVPEYYNMSLAYFKALDFSIEDVCTSPEGISLIEVEATTATIDWMTYSNNTSWIISVIDTATNSITNYSTTTHPFQITNLTPEHTYRITIQSSCGNSVANSVSEIVITTTSIQNCVIPTNFVCENLTNNEAEGTIQCRWDAIEGQSVWQLDYKNKYAFNWERIIVYNYPRYTLRNLDMGQEYMFRVRAICAIGDTSNWTPVIEFRLSSLEDEIDYSSQISIFPNPAKEALNIEYLGNQFGETKLLNQNGQLIQKWSKLPKNIDASSLQSGSYYLQISVDNRKITKKILIVK